MYDSFRLKELTIVVIAKNNNPSILNPDFLKYNKIVGDNWDIAASPLCTDMVAQVRYKNGVSVLAELERLVFSENLVVSSESRLRIPSIAKEYVRRLPHVDYRAIGINPVGHIIADSAAEAEKFVVDNFVSKKPWLVVNKAQAIANLKFVYKLEDVRFAVSIESQDIKQGENESVSTIVFGGNLHREISLNEPEGKIKTLVDIIENCQNDIDFFRQYVQNVLGSTGENKT